MGGKKWSNESLEQREKMSNILLKKSLQRLLGKLGIRKMKSFVRVILRFTEAIALESCMIG